MMNDWAVPPMSQFGTRCAGHEGAGVVVKVGNNVQGWNVGDRAGIKPLWDVCHSCEHCWNGTLVEDGMHPLMKCASRTGLLLALMHRRVVVGYS